MTSSGNSPSGEAPLGKSTHARKERALLTRRHQRRDQHQLRNRDRGRGGRDRSDRFQLGLRTEADRITKKRRLFLVRLDGKHIRHQRTDFAFGAINSLH